MKRTAYLLVLVLAGATLPSVSSAASIFLCRVYGGGSIWSSLRCDPNKAVVEREMYVPDTMSWQEKVTFGEQRMAESQALQQSVTQANRSLATTTSGSTLSTVTTTYQQSPAAICQALAAEVANYDAMARQPQSGQMQDWITEQKRKARSRQTALHC